MASFTSRFDFTAEKICRAAGYFDRNEVLFKTEILQAAKVINIPTIVTRYAV